VVGVDDAMVGMDVLIVDSTLAELGPFAIEFELVELVELVVETIELDASLR